MLKSAGCRSRSRFRKPRFRLTRCWCRSTIALVESGSEFCCRMQPRSFFCRVGIASLKSEFSRLKGCRVMNIIPQILRDDSGQDIAEYAVMLAVILVLVVGTIRLVGSNANNAFSSVASTLQ